MTAISNGLDHIDKYTRSLSKHPVYLAAIVLDPKCKWDYVQSMEKREHPDDQETQYKGEDAEEKVSTSRMAPLNNDYLYALIFDSHQDAPLTAHERSPEKARASGKANRGRLQTPKTKPQAEQIILAAGQDKNSLDEYERWCSKPPDDGIFDHLSYW
ncbi:hypothetical protein FN846DRAFT_913649 [Sphaerosporella brunnea]|uniref:Uncharacterized protein n=1 Tax=Sphaerosporella brunnea TaxID=1250544 RepID=A0A5J5EG96_9PEZI|nr:hypothetical protein FN846DRAFT_913649 [Sphaerosporella brunnea]